MKFLTKKNQAGFTIIEVMIVLAIAGVIMLAMFLAVPALQRNSRNNSRRSDVSKVGVAVNNWVNRNNGVVFPTTGATQTTALNAILTDVGNLSQYTMTASASSAGLSSVNGAQGAISDIDSMRIVTGAVCGTDGATVTDGASSRSLAIQYMEETGGDPAGACQNI